MSRMYIEFVQDGKRLMEMVADQIDENADEVFFSLRPLAGTVRLRKADIRDSTTVPDDYKLYLPRRRGSS